MDQHFEKTWAKYDQNKEGYLRYEEAPTFMRALMGQNNKCRLIAKSEMATNKRKNSRTDNITPRSALTDTYQHFPGPPTTDENPSRRKNSSRKPPKT